MKDNFEIVDIYITEENVNSLFKNEFTPKKIDSHSTIFTVYNLETHNTYRAKPYCTSFYRLSKLAGKYSGDLTAYEYEKCKNVTSVFVGDDCITKALDFLLKFKGEEQKTVINKIVEQILQLNSHNRSGFDTWIVLNNLPGDKHNVEFNKNGKGIVSLTVFNGYIDNGEKQIPPYLISRSGMTP